MGNGYVVPAVEPMDEFRLRFRRIDERLRELEALDGTQIHNTVQELRKLIEGVLEQTEVNVAGSVTAGGNVTAGGAGTFAAGVTSPAVYNNLVSSTPYKVMYINDAGSFGYVPSSRRYKQDIETAALDVRSVMRELRVVTFRYIEAVALAGNVAAVEWGLIAEEVHDLGLTWLVDYDAEGNPDGLKHERWAVLLILDSQDKQAQIDALAGRIDALEA